MPRCVSVLCLMLTVVEKLGPFLRNYQEPYLDGISYNCIAPGKRLVCCCLGDPVAPATLLTAQASFAAAPFASLLPQIPSNGQFIGRGKDGSRPGPPFLHS